MPSIVTSIVNRQYNFGKINQYDNVIERLRCTEGDEHCHLFEEGAPEFCDTPIFSCKFALKQGFTQYLALANEDGKLAVVNVNEKAERFGTWAHANAIFDIAWPYNCMHLITASGDHTAKLFDITNCDIREVRTFYGHTRSVKTVSYRRDDPNVFATGGRDGHIIIWDTRTETHCMIGKPDRQIRNAHFVKDFATRSHRRVYYKSTMPASGLKSVTSLVFRDDNSLISCAAGDGLIKMWDLRKSYQNYRDKPVPKCIISYPGERAKSGFSNLIIDKDFTRLYANCLDNTIYCYNVVTFNTTPIMKYTGYQNNTFYVKSSLSNDGNYLISGSSDENAYIWKTDCSSPYIRLAGHKAEVTSVAWCQTPLPVIVTCSDDMRHKIWRVGNAASYPDNWHYICRGQAEVLTTFNSPRKPKLKRIRCNSDSISQVSKKFIVQCQNCSEVKHETSFCENCKPTEAKSQNQKVELDFLHKSSPCPGQEKILADPDESNHNNQISSSERLDRGGVLCNSPTVNLPNFVADGTAPHISHSPIKKRDIDWLTKMRKDRAFRRELFETYSQNSTAKLTKVDSPAKDGGNKKQTSNNSPQTSLLKFFKIKTNKGDSLASSSKSLNYSFMTSPQSAT